MKAFYSREELHRLVWQTPTRTLAEGFGMSDGALATLCKEADIPRPNAGYWTKIKVGKAVVVTPLPERGLGISPIVSISDRFMNGLTDDRILGLDLSEPPAILETTETIRDRIALITAGLAFDFNLLRPDRSIAFALGKNKLPAKPQRARKGDAQERRRNFGNAIQQRRLQILNALFTAARELGFEGCAMNKEVSDLVFIVNSVRIPFTLGPPGSGEEIARRGSTRLAYNSSFRLELMFHLSKEHGEIRYCWTDAVDGRIEDYVGEIIREALVAAEVAVHLQPVNHHNWLCKRREEIIEKRRDAEVAARKAEIERIRAEEQARIDKLLDEADRLQKAETIRAYVEQVKGLDQSVQTDSWAEWALSQADRIDPVKTGEYLQRI